jgi:type IV secretory pathway VirB3-like protein
VRRTKIRLYELVALEFLVGRGATPGAGWPHCQGAHRTVWCTPDSPVPLRQQTIFFLWFYKIIFVLTCECVIEWHLVIVVSVNVHQHYIRILLVKLLITTPLYSTTKINIENLILYQVSTTPPTLGIWRPSSFDLPFSAVASSSHLRDCFHHCSLMLSLITKTNQGPRCFQSLPFWWLMTTLQECESSLFVF